MRDIELQFSASGYDSIESDVKDEISRLFSMPVIGNALISVRSEMIDNLKEHIKEDVYEEYKPIQYKRRSDDRSLGTPLVDVEADGQSRLLGGVNSSKPTAFISIDYYPKGKHKVKRWSDVDGDELIGRIEKKDPPYKWEPKDSEIPMRPFWQKFVEEQIDSGKALDSFIRAMALNGEIITDDGTGVIREPGDGNY